MRTSRGNSLQEDQPSFGVPGANISGAKIEKSFEDHFADVDIAKIPPPSAPAGFLAITVIDPIKVDSGPGGINSYINYSVKSHTDRPDFEYQNFSAVRRYNDFFWLYETLIDEFPGAVIPPIPEKNLADRFKPAFYEARAKALEKFLMAIAAHMELSTSKNFTAFLQCDDERLQEVKEATQAAKAKIHESFLEGCMHNLTRVKTSLPMTRDVPKTPLDTQFDELESQIHNLDTSIQSVARHASDLVRKSSELGYTTGEFGLAFKKLGEAENEEGQSQLGNMLLSIAQTSLEISEKYKEQCKRENAIFESPLYEYISLLRSVQGALEARDTTKVAYLTAIHDLEGKQNKHANLSKTIKPGAEHQVTNAEQKVKDASAKLLAAKTRYEECSARTVREVEKFNAEQGEDIRKIVVDYVNLQIEYNKGIAESWEQLLPSLEHASIGQSSNALVSGMHGLLTGSHHKA